MLTDMLSFRYALNFAFSSTVQPWAAFEWSEPAEEVLVWSARQPKLLAELQRATADVICLQEVQFERVPVDAADEVTATHGAKTKTEAPEFQLPRWLADGLPGYASVIPPSLGGIAKRNARVLKAEIPIVSPAALNIKYTLALQHTSC